MALSFVFFFPKKNNTADLLMKHLGGLRTQSLAKKLGLRILDGTDGTNGTNGRNDNGGEVTKTDSFSSKRFQSSSGVSGLSFNS